MSARRYDNRDAEKQIENRFHSRLENQAIAGYIVGS
jgi:hypothetical protein